MEDKNSDEWLKDLPIQADNIGYKSEEMIRCAKCARTNPPTRRACLYCGAELEISEAQAHLLKPRLRKLEPWEKGFNVIFTNVNSVVAGETEISEIARLLMIEKELISKILMTKKIVPLARLESEKEAVIAQKYLLKLGVETSIVSDEVLDVEKQPRRLRGMEFSDEKLILILFNRDEIIEIGFDDLILIVTGAVFERRIEATEKYDKKGENKILNSTETTSDESLIDIYSRDDSVGFRILARGFDFSCLEAEKEILAKNNLKKLTDKLRQASPNSKLVDDYLQVRELLVNIWEVEQKIDSQGIKRGGVGKFNLGNVTTVNNMPQFTKYSRLCRHLI